MSKSLLPVRLSLSLMAASSKIPSHLLKPCLPPRAHPPHEAPKPPCPKLALPSSPSSQPPWAEAHEGRERLCRGPEDAQGELRFPPRPGAQHRRVGEPKCPEQPSSGLRPLAPRHSRLCIPLLHPGRAVPGLSFYANIRSTM